MASSRVCLVAVASILALLTELGSCLPTGTASLLATDSVDKSDPKLPLVGAVPDHDDHHLPILPKATTGVLDHGDVLHEGGHGVGADGKIAAAHRGAAAFPDTSSKEPGREKDDQKKPTTAGQQVSHDAADADADADAGAGGAGIRGGETASIDDASEQDLPTYWRTDAERFFLPKISPESEEVNDSREITDDDAGASNKERSLWKPDEHAIFGRSKRYAMMRRSLERNFGRHSASLFEESNHLPGIEEDRAFEGEDDLIASAQSIKGYASKLPPYSTSNVRFSDYHKKNAGRPLSSSKNDKEFKPFTSAFDKQTAQRLSSIKVTTNAKRFGFRG